MRVLFIGLDACDPSLVRQWADAGLLPVMRDLLARAHCADTLNPPGLFVGAIWPTICTGVSPAAHGWFADKQLRSGGYDFHHTLHPRFVLRESFWLALSRAGRRVATVDMPHTAVVPVNGICVSQWGAHDPVAEFDTWPPSLAEELLSRFGRHPILPSCDHYRTTHDLGQLRDDLVRAAETKADLVVDVLGREDWDFFGAVFCESHCVGHQCWHVHDPGHSAHDPAEAARIGDPLRDVYVALDRALGRVLAAAGPDTMVMVLWSHGFGPHYDATHLLEEALYHWDVGPRRLKLRKLTRPVRQPLGRLKRRILGEPTPEPTEDTTRAIRNPHFAKRRCFSVPNYSVSGAIRINLVGREPHGRIHPGREYDALVDALRRDLMEWTDAASGVRLVRDVYRVADRYAGKYLDQLPDLIVEWSCDRVVHAVYSPSTGLVRVPYEGARTGDHTPVGRVAIVGPGVAPGRLPEAIQSVDLAPTIAGWLGVTLEDVEGRPMSLSPEAATTVP